jgi:hypothetical protein
VGDASDHHEPDLAFRGPASTSFVGIVSRRAASDTRSISAAIEPSFVESQLTAEPHDLLLELHQDQWIVAVGERVARILERGEEVECRFQVVRDGLRRLGGTRCSVLAA